MKKVWVLGSSGQLGFYLCERMGASVAGVSARGFSHSELDVSNLSDLPQKLDGFARGFANGQTSVPDVLINATAYNLVDKAEEDRLACSILNEEVPRALAKWAKEYKSQFIHFSTDFVFSGEGGVAWRESDRAQPLNFYGQSKLDGERAVGEENPQSLIFRTSWVYSHRRENFVLAILKRALAQNELSVVSDQVGQPTYADELARITIEIGKESLGDSKVGGIYNLSDEGAVSRFEFAKEILAQASEWEPKYRLVQVKPVLSSAFKAAATRPLNSRLDLEKVRSTFGVNPKPWRENLQSCLRRYYGAR